MSRTNYGRRSASMVARAMGTPTLSDRRRALVFEFRRLTEDRIKSLRWLDNLDDMLALTYYRLRTEQGGMTPQRAWEVLGGPSDYLPGSKRWKVLFERGQVLDEYAADQELRKAESADAQASA